MITAAASSLPTAHSSADRTPLLERAAYISLLAFAAAPQFSIAASGILLGLTAAVLIWWRPRAAELDMWIAVVAGLLGALFTFAITITAEAGVPGPAVIIAGMLIGGGVQALTALAAALLARRWARRLEGSIA